MSAADITREVMSHFDALAGDAHLTIVLGAGASASVGLPDWDTFAVRVAVASGIVPHESAGRLLLQRQDPMIVLEGARQRSGDRWSDILRHALYGDTLEEPELPSTLHLAAAGHFFSSAGRTTLATLNFDTLLESALLSDAPVVGISTDGEDVPDLPTVHHLHGYISPEDVKDAVVGFRDFADLVAQTEPWQREFLSAALARGPLLLSGTSYRDPDIRQWLHVILRDEAPSHHPVVTLVREGLGLSADEFDSLSEALVAEWEAIGLSALRLQDLADAATVIRELQYARRAEYLPPSERAQIVWTRHNQRFADLQPVYAKWLEEESARMREVIGVPVHRATLWLADARRHLARWATEGATFDGVRTLKRVPSGHDSPWIAGEAIGAEQVKLKDVERDERVRPSWWSVLAVPILVGDGVHPEFASAVVTFGLSARALKLLDRQHEWNEATEELSSTWGTRLSAVAFPQMEH